MGRQSQVNPKGKKANSKTTTSQKEIKMKKNRKSRLLLPKPTIQRLGRRARVIHLAGEVPALLSSLSVDNVEEIVRRASIIAACRLRKTISASNVRLALESMGHRVFGYHDSK